MVAKSSYSASVQEVGELFGDYLEGGAERPVLVIGQNRPAQTGAVRDALTKSFETLGFGDEACSFASLSGINGDMPAIDPDALFLLLEGLDPLFVICIDEAAVRQVAAAYRTKFELDAATRAFGRPAVMFENLSELLETERGKRSAWELFKTLPRK